MAGREETGMSCAEEMGEAKKSGSRAESGGRPYGYSGVPWIL